MKSSTIGTLHELKAIQHFLENDWEVFYNIKPHGPADIIIWNPETDETIKVDIKTIQAHVKSNGDSTFTFSGLGKVEDMRKFVKYFGYLKNRDEFVWFDDVIEKIGFKDELKTKDNR